MANNAAGIAMTSFIVAVAVSIAFYQFVYIPEANAKPVLPPNYTKPPDTTPVTIVPGANIQNSVRNFVPKDPQTILGQSNRVTWTNNDNVPHTVTSDDKYVDKFSGSFNSLDQQDSVPGGYILPGKSFTFVFTQTGSYSYHCEPHPWMQGKIEVVPSLA
ncbi:MAG: plastocyanin/azurin family copper-binding protein [Nitrososphaera sp.]|jgi:plastocyanin